MMMMMMAVVGVDLVRFGYDCQDPWQHDDQWFSTNEETTTSRIAASFFSSSLLCGCVHLSLSSLLAMLALVVCHDVYFRSWKQRGV